MSFQLEDRSVSLAVRARVSKSRSQSEREGTHSLPALELRDWAHCATACASGSCRLLREGFSDAPDRSKETHSFPEF